MRTAKIKAGLPARPPAYDIMKKLAVLIASALVAIFALYSITDAYQALSAVQWASVAIVTATATILYIIFDREIIKGTTGRIAAVTASYALVAILLYHASAASVFRSDYWLLLNVFNSFGGFSTEALREISLFEIFGDTRFQPLAHLTMYIRHLIFGYNMYLYHAANIALHIVTGLLIYFILYRETRSASLSFLFGLLFIALYGHFDTVVWTYHIYIIIGAVLILACVRIMQDIDTEASLRRLVPVVLLSLFSFMLYEPAVAAPALLMLMIPWSATRGLGGDAFKRQLIKAVIVTGAAYFFYLCLTLYGTSLIGEGKKVTVGGLLTAENFIGGIKGVLHNLWYSTFLNNTGIETNTKLWDILYIYPQKALLSNPLNIIKVALGIFMIFCLRPTRKNWKIVSILLLITLSYIYVISLGRVHSNTILYFVSQPRYQYFTNAFFTLTAGILLWPLFKKQWFRPLLATILISFIFWNARSVTYWNAEIAEEMSFMDKPFYQMSEFTDNNPDAVIYTDFVPFNEARLYLGSEISMDLLFEGHLTKFKSRATHIYDGKTFKENPLYRGRELPAELGDFAISWMYKRLNEPEPWPDVVVLGSDDIYPKISVGADRVLTVSMIDAKSGKVQEVKLRHDLTLHWKPFAEIPPWRSFLLVKDGDELCLFIGGRRYDRARLQGPYKQWQADGRDLLGPHFTGKGGKSFVSAMLVELGTRDLSCKADILR